MRKLTAALLGYVLLTVVLASIACAADFADVPEGFWAREDIRYVTDRGIFQGKTPETFAPSSGMTRGQMAMVLYRLAGQPATEAAMRYADVRNTAYYYDAIRWAREKRIFTAEKQTADTLTPDETIARGEFAVMLRNFDAVRNGGVTTGEPLETRFTDMDETSTEVRNAILGWAYPNGILRGTSETTMNPNGPLTRAHVAAMLARYDRLFGNASGSSGSTNESRNANGTSGFDFGVVTPNTFRDVYTGQLKENTTYTLMVGESYGDGNYAITSSDESVVSVSYQHYAWVLEAKSSGKAVLTATDRRTGNQQTLPVTVGASEKAPEDTSGNLPDLNANLEYRQEIIRLANQVRVQGGAKELVPNEALMNAAQVYAETMPYDHDSDLESELRNRYGCYHGVACNLQRSSGYDLPVLAERTVQSWVESRGHYLTMMNESADSIGVGMFYNSSNKMWFLTMYVGDCLLESELFGNPHQ